MAVISAWPLPEGIKSVEVNGYPMAYQESGSGTPLVLVHGSMNDYRCWNLQIPAFTAHYRVLAVSLRHYFSRAVGRAGRRLFDPPACGPPGSEAIRVMRDHRQISISQPD